MANTPNYNLKKVEYTEIADIPSHFNANFDTIDTAMKNNADAATAAEVNAKSYASGLIGTLSNLLTTAKNNIVAAVNEIFGKVEDVEDSLATHLAELVDARTSITKGKTFDTLGARLEEIEQEGGSAEKTAYDNAESELEAENVQDAIDETVGMVKSHLAETIHQGKHSTLEATSTDDATSVTDAPLKSAGGLAVAKNVYLNNARLLKIDGGVCFVKGSLHNREYGFGFSLIEANKRIAFVFQLEAGNGYLMQIAVGGGQAATGTLSRVKCMKKDIAFRLAYNNTINTVVEHTGLISGFDATDVYIEAHPVETNRIILYIENNSTWATRLTPTISIQSGGNSTFIESYIEDIPV